VISTDDINAAGKSSKLIPPLPASAPTVDTPFISTLFSSVPRICTAVPTPAVLVICMPVTFSNTSAKFWSGSFPISAA
jgi:hypothetical protein